jgi:hypothetical protein
MAVTLNLEDPVITTATSPYPNFKNRLRTPLQSLPEGQNQSTLNQQIHTGTGSYPHCITSYPVDFKHRIKMHCSRHSSLCCCPPTRALAASAHSLPEPPAVDLGEGGTVRGRLASLWVPLELCASWLL